MIRLRYPARCAGCGAELAARSPAWWDAEAKTARCETCGSSPTVALAGGAAPSAPVCDAAADTAGAVDAGAIGAPGGTRIRVRFSAQCAGCGVELAKSTWAWWNREAKTMHCDRCATGSPSKTAAEPSDHVPTAPPDEAALRARPTRSSGTAGGSAQAEYERRKAKRQDTIRSRHPRLGGLILALTDDPQSTTAWAKGAEGERKLGAGLDTLAAAGVVALHDRRIPGSRANIDHVAVTPTGVWVIDAKRYTGQVAKRDVGGWLRRDIRLYVGRRDCTKLVEAMPKQVSVVHAALGAVWPEVPVRPVLCFIDAEWGLLAKPFEFDGVLITRGKALWKRLAQPGKYTPADIDLITEQLETTLKPAT